MLKIRIITVGKLKEPAFVDIEKEYLKRLGPFAKTEIIQLPEEPYKKEIESSISRAKEADKISRLIEDGCYLIALGEEGKPVTTLQFAQKIAPVISAGRSITFVIGSSSGLDNKIKKRANWLFSLSPLTFTHNFARVLLEEQIYRAFTLMSGKTYHK